MDKDVAVKTLGMHWDPKRDVYTFSAVDFKTLAHAATKGAVLTNIARLFDPLGRQTPLPITLRDRWLEYCNWLASLSELSMDRWLGASPGQSYQLHDFSDAPSRAYAATV